MNNIRHLFVSGQVQKIYKIYLKQSFNDSDFTWILGALCLLGKLDEAQDFALKRKLESAHIFFLVLAVIRRSDFESAKKLIKKLQMDFRKSEEAAFFYYQAMAIYAYYKSRYKSCLVIVKKSRAFSLNLNESFWKVLALDLLGHTHVQMGDVYKGISFLEEAHDLASMLGNKTFQQATKISILNYQSQYSIEPNKLILTIEKKLKLIARNDNYSEGVLSLSLCHLYLLVGEMEKAVKILSASQKIIFSSSSPRHKSQWFFEKAYYHFLAGKYDLALSFLSEAIGLINPENEIKVVLKILGLKRRIFKLLGKSTIEIDQNLISLTLKIGDPQSINKLARDKLISSEVSEDPLQEVFDNLFNKNSNTECIELGYFGPLRQELINLTNALEQSFLVTGLWKNGILILTPKSLLVRKSGVSTLLLTALKLLSTKANVSKDELVSVVWGYQYDPFRHDSLIYALIHRLRDVLGPLEKGLIGENHQYTLSHNFKHLDLSVETMPNEAANENLQLDFNKAPQWNIRQHKVIGLINKGQTFKVSEYARVFNVSLITALRDLKELKDHKVINVFGKGRATTYANL